MAPPRAVLRPGRLRSMAPPSGRSGRPRKAAYHAPLKEGGVPVGCPLPSKIKRCFTSDADKWLPGIQRGRVPEDQPQWVRHACQAQGERIREAREHANLTQEKLAERAELGRSTIQRIEAGQGIKYAHLLLIAHALDVPVTDLLRDGGIPGPR